MNQVIAVLSMLHESAGSNSAVRRFRNKSVLEWTLSRLARGESLDGVTVLCWDDQYEAASEACGNAWRA